MPQIKSFLTLGEQYLCDVKMRLYLGDYMRTHGALVNLLKTLGYQSLGEGVCLGASVRWMEDALSRKKSRFDQFLDKVSTCDNLVKEIEQAQFKQGKNLTSEDELLIDILAFCDSVMLYQRPQNGASYFNERVFLCQQDILKISQVASSAAIEAHGGLSTIYTTSTFYSIEDLANYLNNLASVLKDCSGSASETFGMIFSSAKHAIGLTYSQDQGWHLMDINYYPATCYENDIQKLSLDLFKSLYARNKIHLLFTISIYTLADNPQLATLRERFVQFKESHIWTEDRVQQAQSLSLAYPLVQCFDGDTILALSKSGYDINKPVTENLWTPLHHAAVFGNDNLIRALLDAGANPEQTDSEGMSSIHIAVMFGNLATVRAFVAHCYAVNQSGINQGTSNAAKRNGWNLGVYNKYIILLVVKQSDIAVLMALIKEGIDVNANVQCTEDMLRTFVSQQPAFIEQVMRQYKKNRQGVISIRPADLALILKNNNLSQMLTAAKKITALYNQIELFKAYGDTCLDEQERNAVLNLADDFEDIANRYFIARYKTGNDEECANIRQEFKAAIAKGKASGYAVNWQTFLINIALAASVLGLLFMAAKYVRTGNAFFACVYSDAWKKVDAIESALRPHL